ncbi:hypothetical protein B0H14DRAFT_126400 [Mycena olivaceomarginata]|nr:hypothetical protein B0H14DRAFT_126400 [Mycena olivaceomarginata]
MAVSDEQRSGVRVFSVRVLFARNFAVLGLEFIRVLVVRNYFDSFWIYLLFFVSVFLFILCFFLILLRVLFVPGMSARRALPIPNRLLFLLFIGSAESLLLFFPLLLLLLLQRQWERVTGELPPTGVPLRGGAGAGAGAGCELVDGVGGSSSTISAALSLALSLTLTREGVRCSRCCVCVV